MQATTAKPDVDITEWIGKQRSSQDFICETLVRRMAATLGVASPEAGAPLPALWHWMFFQPELNSSELGADGHPQVGGFMPPAPLASGRNRMWAGGQLEFNQPLIIGEAATCDSVIENVVEKQGATGSLVFVTVRHDYTQQGEHKFTERQNIVYRLPTSPKESSDAAPKSQWSRSITPDATLLFRYSAVTFNGHRIHYDYPYVTDTEGYDNVVVHGPLMATLALHGCINAHPDKTVKSFKYRGIRPVTLGHDIYIEGRTVDDSHAEVWISNDNGVIQQGQVEFVL